MASRALTETATSPDDYLKVYDRILTQVKEPVVIHWLGEMFDPALAGYWGSDDHWAAMDTCLEMLARNAAKVDGIKVSLLNAEKEIAMRNKLPGGVLMYTGDDFNFPELIAGDDDSYSHALLGIFDAIAPAASAALQAMGRQDMDTYHDILAPTVSSISTHIQGTHPVLQNRSCLHGLSERAPKSFHFGRWSGKRPVTHTSGGIVQAG